MKYLLAVLLGITLCALVGCENIRHKSFVGANSTLGLKATLGDPATGSSTPILALGNVSTVVATGTPGSKVSADIGVNSVFTKDPLFNMHIEIDGTHCQKFNTTKEETDYSPCKDTETDSEEK